VIPLILIGGRGYVFSMGRNRIFVEYTREVCAYLSKWERPLPSAMYPSATYPGAT